MTTIQLNQQLRRIEITDLTIANDVVFSYFDRLPAKDRSEALFRAIYFGVLAQMEDRLASFLAKTESELGVRLESLKQIFEMKKELFYKSSLKGAAAEENVGDFLESYAKRRGWNDDVGLTGGQVGVLPRNKTGDVIIKVDRRDDLRLVVECKFDKSIRLGEIDKRDASVRRVDTIWSQLLESSVNRDGRAAIIVLDRALIDASVLSSVESVGYIKHVGFVAVVDSQAGDYSNLAIAYGLARDIALGAIRDGADPTVLTILVRRLISDLEGHAMVRRGVEQIVGSCQSILLQMNKTFLMVQFTQEYLAKFLAQGGLSSKDLLDYYQAESVREKYALLERDIAELANAATTRV